MSNPTTPILARRSRSSTGASSPPRARTPSAPRSRSPSTASRPRCPFGTTILEAAEHAGVRSRRSATTPTSTWPASAASASSRSKASARCSRPAPSRSSTRSRSRRTARKVRMARRHVLDLLLTEHYGECYSCVRNDNCELQSLAEEYGVTEFAFGHPEEPAFEPDHVQLLGDARHEQVHPLPPLRPHLHRPPGSRRARGRRPQQQGHHRDLRGQAPRLRGLHQLRPVHQPLPHRRPVRQGRDRRGVGGHRRPRQARRHPDRPGAAVGDRRALRPRAGHAGHVRDEHGPAPRRLRQGLRHQLHRRPHDHRGGHRAHPAPLQGAGAGRQGRRPAAVHQLLAGLGQVPRALLPRVPAQRLERQEPAADVRRAHQDLLRREAGPRPREDRQRARSCPARPRSSSATGPRWTTPASRTSTTASPRASSARCSRKPGCTCRACPRATSTTRSAPPPAPASSSAPPAA